MNTEVLVHDKRFGLLLSPAQVQARVQLLAPLLNQHFVGRRPVLMPILTGALRLLADVMPQLTVPYRLAPLRLSSYRAAMHSQGPPTVPDMPFSLAGQDVVILEDILDTGRTITALMQALHAQGVASVFLAALLRKPDCYLGHAPQWVGFDIPPAFVVGYGMDYAEEGRHLPGIYQLLPEP